jgi:hypothetical protein
MFSDLNARTSNLDNFVIKIESVHEFDIVSTIFEIDVIDKRFSKYCIVTQLLQFCILFSLSIVNGCVCADEGIGELT